MSLRYDFDDIGLGDVKHLAARAKGEGWRFVQLFATQGTEGVDLTYTFLVGDEVRNLRVRDIAKGQPVPSITNEFLAAFVFENEAHDLFGVNIEGIAIDFAGNFYQTAVPEPMAVVSAAKLAEREKAAKVAAAKAAKEARAAREAAEAAAATDAEEKGGE